MKRLGLIMMSVALVLGMAQCKKNVEPIAATTSGTMNITLDVDGGSKVAVNPSTGVVNFQTGDKIYVAYNGSYVGTLEHNGTNFTGNITATPDGSKYLYFYFVGNKTPNEDPTTSMEVDIYDQTDGTLPVISAASSNEYFSTSTYTYTATLLNKCALVKFNVTSNSTSAPVVIGGVKDRVTIAFAAGSVGTFTNSQNKGFIKLAANEETGVEEERWAIMLSQDAVASSTKKYVANSEIIASTHGDIPAITDNDYLSTGIEVEAELIEGAIPGLFTINSSGGQVCFSQGNLQYQSSTQTWRFAENQYDYIGSTTANATPTSGQEGWMDLFCWGRWTGADADAVTPSSGASSFTDFNHSTYSISNGYGNSWRTLTNEEHGYLFNTRTASTINGVANAKFSKATVAGVFGVMLFPDSFTWPEGVSLPTANAINQTGDYTAGSYDAAAWTKLEAAGAVFFPAAGNRDSGSVTDSGSYGLYWSSTISGRFVYYVVFDAGDFEPQYGYSSKGIGYSVRLVL